LRAAVIYWSKTGNTERVAHTIVEGLQSAGVEVTVRQAEEADDLDWLAYDLICLGFPAYRWHPPQPMDKLLIKKFAQYRSAGQIRVGAPAVPGRRAVIFCTYSGPHTGIREAIPAALYAGQFFEHLGFTVLGEWYIVGEFHGDAEASTQGRLGDVRGRPNDEDLATVRQNLEHVLRHTQATS